MKGAIAEKLGFYLIFYEESIYKVNCDFVNF